MLKKPGSFRCAETLAVLAVAASAWLPASSEACSPAVDNRTYAQRLAAEPLAFIGTITAVNGRKVTFDVEHTINGADHRTRVVEAAPPSTCAISFKQGQKWLFAGSLAFSPSVLLRADVKSSQAGKGERLRRVDDSRLALPASWQACQSNAECVAVPEGCEVTAASSEHADAARRRAMAVAGAPRAMECARRDGVELIPQPQCMSQKCGMLFVDFKVVP